MNTTEFGSKTLLLYSLKKNERMDLSCLPDEVFDKVIHGFWQTKIFQEGSPFDGKCLMNKSKAATLIEMLKSDVASAYPHVNKLIAYLGELDEGEVFRMVSQDAPTMNKQLAVLKIRGLAKGEDERTIHNRYLFTWGRLSTKFRHFSFGYDGLKTTVGEGDKKKRVCRFCGKKHPYAKYNSVAHAISEGLGNKLLLCNEECDDCNNKLSKTESNLMHYLDIRRAMGGVLTKTDGMVPSVDGKGFVIRGDENNQAVLYIEKETLHNGLDESGPFNIQLETEETITHQGIYKSLCKIVIDLLPTSEMVHFDQTIGWINGAVMDNKLPSYLAAYNLERVHQPTVDIFLSNNSDEEPYCTAIVHILDVLFVFILPEVDVDNARFKTFASIQRHLGNFASLYDGKWHEEDSSEYTLAHPWAIWTVRPDDPQVEIRPKSDPVFIRYKKVSAERKESMFPEFKPDGISAPEISKVNFKPHSHSPVSIAELHQVSINVEHMVCTLDKVASIASFFFAFNFSDSSNRLSYFDFNFEAVVRIEFFDRYIETDEWFCIDYHLRDFLCRQVLIAADVELRKFTMGTDLQPINLQLVLDKRAMRQLYYRVPMEGKRYLVVKDAMVHNI